MRHVKLWFDDSGDPLEAEGGADEGVGDVCFSCLDGSILKYKRNMTVYIKSLCANPYLFI